MRLFPPRSRVLDFHRPSKFGSDRPLKPESIAYVLLVIMSAGDCIFTFPTCTPATSSPIRESLIWVLALGHVMTDRLTQTTSEVVCVVSPHINGRK